ncbi:MarR family winged helix-turn-helix transcriptional regulator [Aquimarina rhabdastrellae]
MKDKAYFEAVIEIIRTGHSLTDAVSKQLKPFGIYEPQFNVLRILRGAKGKPLTVNQILERMIQRSSNITRIVDKLLSKELVERKPSSIDRRKMDIVISNKGLLLLEELDKAVEALHEPIQGNLTEEEAIQLKTLILKLKGDYIK